MPDIKLDEIDLKILSTLQNNGRTKRNKLAEEVKLSIPSVSERLRKLEESGVILGYHSVLDARSVGLEVSAFIFLTTESSKFYAKIIERANEHEEILECHAITGDGSHILKVRTESTETLESLLSKIQAWPGVLNTRTDVVLSSPKETDVLPLSQMKNKL